MSTLEQRERLLRDTKARTCQECGMLLHDAAEFHPYVFCILKKAGRDPWAELRLLAHQLGLDPLPAKPPLVSDLGNIDRASS